MQPALDLRDVGAVEVSAVSQFLLAEFALVPEEQDWVDRASQGATRLP
jgi:hypothetical protein